MANYFQNSRNVELSTIYYLENEINNNWSGVTIVKGFLQDTTTQRPVVAIRLISDTPTRFEIGNNRFAYLYTISIEIFAKSDGQRIDLARFITDKLAAPWTYYIHSHSSGDPSSLDRIADGVITLNDFLTNERVDINADDIEDFDKFRHAIVFDARKGGWD